MSISTPVSVMRSVCSNWALSLGCACFACVRMLWRARERVHVRSRGGLGDGRSMIPPSASYHRVPPLLAEDPRVHDMELARNIASRLREENAHGPHGEGGRGGQTCVCRPRSPLSNHPPGSVSGSARHGRVTTARSVARRSEGEGRGRGRSSWPAVGDWQVHATHAAIEV